MDLMTAVTFDPVRSLHPVDRLAARPVPTASQQQMISMLHAQGRITDREALRLAERPHAVDDVMMLTMLFDRHDLTDVDYHIEMSTLLA